MAKSDLQKLDSIVKRNGDIKAFPLASNLISSKGVGKSGWGEVTVAVDTGSVQKLFSDEAIGVLYIVSKEEWEKEAQ